MTDTRRQLRIDEKIGCALNRDKGAFRAGRIARGHAPDGERKRSILETCI